MSYETVKEKLEYNQENPIHFLKYSAKYNILDGSKVKDMNDFKDYFPFVNDDKNKFKNLKNTEFALAWFKEYGFKKENDVKYFEINKKDLEKIKSLNEIPDVETLILYSFILQADIKLKSPYFSSDDEFYLIQNPCLKDRAFKVPMVKGSGWKGAIAKAGKDLINGELEKNNNNKVRDYIQSYLRIFGTGSKEFRDMQDMIVDYLNKSKKLEKDKVIKFILFELGMKIRKKDIDALSNPDEINKWLKEKIWENLDGNQKKIPIFLNTHKGRAIFYPTYFYRLSLEIINPHSIKTRAGTNPIHYEVVPKDTEGILQIVYIPHDGILTEKDKLKEEVEKDIDFLTKCIEKTAENGIGAKTKLGWGRFEFKKKSIECNVDVKLPQGWQNGS